MNNLENVLNDNKLQTILTLDFMKLNYKSKTSLELINKIIALGCDRDSEGLTERTLMDVDIEAMYNEIKSPDITLNEFFESNKDCKRMRFQKDSSNTYWVHLYTYLCPIY